MTFSSNYDETYYCTNVVEMELCQDFRTHGWPWSSISFTLNTSPIID
jgi:hypothetical protein